MSVIIDMEEQFQKNRESWWIYKGLNELVQTIVDIRDGKRGDILLAPHGSIPGRISEWADQVHERKEMLRTGKVEIRKDGTAVQIRTEEK